MFLFVKQFILFGLEVTMGSILLLQDFLRTIQTYVPTIPLIGDCELWDNDILYDGYVRVKNYDNTDDDDTNDITDNEEDADDAEDDAEENANGDVDDGDVDEDVDDEDVDENVDKNVDEDVDEDVDDEDVDDEDVDDEDADEDVDDEDVDADADEDANDDEIEAIDEYLCEINKKNKTMNELQQKNEEYNSDDYADENKLIYGDIDEDDNTDYIFHEKDEEYKLFTDDNINMQPFNFNGMSEKDLQKFYDHIIKEIHDSE